MEVSRATAKALIRSVIAMPCIAFSAPLWADAPADGPAVPAAAPAATPLPLAAEAPATVPARTLVLHASTLVSLRFMETVASDASLVGSNFRMQVTDGISVDDTVVIPAGSIAIGEVIDSQRAGALGKEGKLVVSARYVKVGEREIRLRSNLGQAGQIKYIVPFFVPFIHGKQATIAADTVVVAKTAKDEVFDVPTAVAH